MALHFRHKQVLAIELSALPATPTGQPIQFRCGTLDDLHRQKGHPDYGYGAIPYLEGRLQAGDSFVLGERDGELVMTAWLARGQMEIGELIVPIPKDHAYHYKLFTLERFRRQGAARGLWSFLRERLREQGIAQLISTVETRNTPSVTAHKQVGFRPIGSFAELSVGPLSGYVLSGSLRSYLRDQRLPS